MSALLANWKTGAAGLIIIILGAFGSFFGIHVPGFSMDFGTALTTGIALILAKDAAPSA